MGRDDNAAKGKGVVLKTTFTKLTMLIICFKCVRNITTNVLINEKKAIMAYYHICQNFTSSSFKVPFTLNSKYKVSLCF